jgi:hypothetical protein
MKSALRWAVVIGGCGLLAWVLTGGGADPLLWLHPSFRVTAVDPSKKQMILQRENHRYVVDCAAACDSFGVGKSYRLREQGGVMKYHGREFRIIEQQIFFENGPGGVG